MSLRTDVADLLAKPGARRDVSLTDELEGLQGTSAAIEGPVTLAVSLERVPEGIVVRGTVRGEWTGDCSNCLNPLQRELSVHVDELFEPDPVEGETYLLEGHEIDLEQLARDALLLELPLAPRCDVPCEPAGPTGSDRDDIDPRWAALADLEL